MKHQQPSPETQKLLLTLIKHTTLPILIEKEQRKREQKEKDVKE